MKLLTRVTNSFDRTLHGGVFLASILLAFMMLSIGAEVVIRNFTRGSISWWVIETTEYMLLYITFVGAAWVLSKEGHVKMDLVLSRLKPRAQSRVNIVTSILCAITCFVIAWYGVKVAWGDFQTGYYLPKMLRPPNWPIIAIIPVGSFLLFIQFLRRTYGFLKGRRA